MKVSIIYPFFNSESFIKESLSSVNLDKRDYELIAIDDCSTDNSLQVFKNASESLRINSILLRRKSNDGCFKARTEAIMASHGEYIAIFDSDDILLPYRLEKQVNFLDNNKDIWCVGGWAEKIDESGKSLGLMDYPPKTNKEIIQSILDKNYGRSSEKTHDFSREMNRNNVNIKFLN